jgi:hypothetical protein
MMMKGKHLKTSFLKHLLNSVELPQDLRCNVFIPCSTGGKAHKGTDYAAPTGTPITTAARKNDKDTGQLCHGRR